MWLSTYKWHHFSRCNFSKYIVLYAPAWRRNKPAEFFPFKEEVEVVYYYGINEEKLKTEENLFRTITNKVKSKITEERKVSFGIYPTQYENDYIYAEYFSPKIQEIILDKE